MTAARRLLRHFLLSFAGLVFVGAIQFSLPSRALASGTRHIHVEARTAAKTGMSALGAAIGIAAVKSDTALSGGANASGCPMHDKQERSEKPGQCCGSGCCVVALIAVSDPQFLIAGASEANLLWSEQFAIKTPVSGNDRPPDFCA